MKITKSKLKKIIEEEMSTIGRPWDDWSEEDKNKYAKLTKKKSPTTKKTPAVTAYNASTMANPNLKRTTQGNDRDQSTFQTQQMVAATKKRGEELKKSNDAVKKASKKYERRSRRF